MRSNVKKEDVGKDVEKTRRLRRRKTRRKIGEEKSRQRDVCIV